MRTVTWQQIIIGQLSRNIFWQESPQVIYRDTLASATVIWDDKKIILVDPSCPIEKMNHILNCVGLTADDVDMIFCTHFHDDHRVDATKYPNANLYMSPQSIMELQENLEKNAPYVTGCTADYTPAEERLTENVKIIPLPGHTKGQSGLLLRDEAGRVLISGDAVMGEEHFINRAGHLNNVDLDATVRSIDYIKQISDWVVPGHGSMFPTSLQLDAGMSWRPLINVFSEVGKREGNCSLLSTQSDNILVNPPSDQNQLEQLLFNRAGIYPEDITAVISTSFPEPTKPLPAGLRYIELEGERLPVLQAATCEGSIVFVEELFEQRQMASELDRNYDIVVPKFGSIYRRPAYF